MYNYNIMGEFKHLAVLRNNISTLPFRKGIVCILTVLSYPAKAKT